MSILLQNKNGWVLDSCALIDCDLSSCIRLRGDSNKHCKCCFKRQCFQTLKLPYGTNSAVSVNSDIEPKNTSSMRISRKRKRKHSDLNQGEIDSKVYHEKVRTGILEGTKCLVEAVRSLGYLDGVADAVDDPLPRPDCNLAALCDMAKELPLVDDENEEDQVQFLPEDPASTSYLDLFTRITENNMDSAMEVTLMGENYIIPPHTAFLLSDFTRIQPLVHYGRFDLIVLDPPWENKSVKRSGRYSCLPSSQLRQLPVPLLASPGSLVVTWVTNKPSLLRLVREQLYPHWGVQVLAEWFWVKVTTSGEYVFPLDSPHKKPYEVLVLGRYQRDDPISSESHQSNSPLLKSESPLEDRRVIVSVPSAFHSQKPALSEILRPYVGPGARCLELFARSLHQGWTCWGNEVLKFQHAAYYDTQPATGST